MVDSVATVPAFPTFVRLSRTDEQTLVEKYAKTPAVQKDIDYYKANIQKVKSVDDLMKDHRLLKVVLSAYALDDDMKYPGRVKQILLSKLGDQNSLAAKMRDPRYKQMASDLAIGDFGVSNLKSTTVVNKVIAAFKTNEYEKNLEQQNPALRQAAYFLRKIGSVKSIYDILGDSVLRSVVTSAADIPLLTAVQSLEKQTQVFDRAFDVKKVNDKAYVTKFIQKFLIKADSDAASQSGGTGLAALFDNSQNANDQLLSLAVGSRVNVLA
jgi:hypothetical protein